MTYTRPTDGPSRVFDPPLNTVRSGFEPTSAFLEAYSKLGPKKDNPVTPPKADGVDGAFDGSLNTLNKSGRPQPFNDNGQRGNLYMDNAGLVLGAEFTDGANKGQKYLAKRDTAGNITQLQVSFPEAGGKPGEPITLNKTDKGWVTSPSGKALPQFKHLNVKDGAIQGDFKLDNNGDLTYETQVGDKQFKDILRTSGNKEFYNMTDYVGETESAKGEKQAVYWTGYGEWAPGQVVPAGREGAMKVVFQPKEGRPASMIRDTKTNGFEVDFGPGKTSYKVDNWKDARMTRTVDGKTIPLFTTGTTDESGALQWREGQDKVDGDVRTVTFNKPEDAAKVRAGELPKETKIDLKTGTTTAVYANDTEVVSDSRGQATRINYKNKPHVDVVRDVNNQFRGFKRADGTTITKGANVNLGPGKLGAMWTIQKPGQPPVTMPGAFRATNAGGFEIDGGAKDGVAIDGDGNLTTKVGGRVVSEAPQPKPVTPPNDAKTEAKANPPKDPPKPKDVPPPPTKPEVKPEQPKPGTDKPKAPLTREQMLELAQKYKFRPQDLVKILDNVKERMEKNGQADKCTKENIDTLLKLADKHKLIGDFIATGGGMNSRPGTFMVKIIPELLTDPDNALNKMQEQMKDIQRRGIGQQRPDLLDGILNSIDQKFDQVRKATQPFVDDVKKEIASKKPEPPKPTPIPPPKPPG